MWAHPFHRGNLSSRVGVLTEMALHTSLCARPRDFARTGRVTFAEAVRDHQDELYGVALRILGDRDAAHDAVSRALLKAFRSWASYDPTRPVRHWLLRIAANEAISIGRARTRDGERRAGAEDALNVPDRTPLPDERLVAREERERVRQAVAGLPERYRVPVVLRYFSELSIEEIATVTGRPASTLGVQLLRARAMLRTMLEATR
jgi:RNA polymerase sigma-70 factor (ECF subfamily)